MQLALETGGESLVEGLQLFTEDLARGRISMTDDTAFEVGKNVCTTPGTVVFQNDLIQLIQYTPTTAKVYERPLVIVPPCINKYYILDLQPANSFVGHAVEQGHTVFLVSWRNAGAGQGKLTWDDYLEPGVLTAIDVALRITGADRVNTLGFCVGGTLLASALAILAARGEQKAASVTLLTTMLDFTDTGEIGLLVSEDGVAQKESSIGKGGLLKGSELAQVFASLRANDLIWPYVVKGYLKGQAPPAFDLLVLEQRRHQPARPDVLLVRPQHLPGEQAPGARRDRAAAASGRPGQRRRSVLRLCLQRGPHRAVEDGLREHADPLR